MYPAVATILHAGRSRLEAVIPNSGPDSLLADGSLRYYARAGWKSEKGTRPKLTSLGTLLFYPAWEQRVEEEVVALVPIQGIS
jgi:hypothetical protein